VGEKAISCALFQIAFPSVVSSVITQAAGTITTFFVSALDDPVMLGSVGLGAMAQNVFGFSLGLGVTSALDTLVSQSHGAGEHLLSGRYLRQAQIICLLVCVPAGLALYYSEAFFRTVGVNAQSAADAGAFVRGTLPAMPLFFLYEATRCYLRCVGLPRADSVVSLLVVALHPLWCYLLIHKLRWGAYGAGLTISVSNAFRFTLLSLYIAVVRPGHTRLAWRILPLPCDASLGAAGRSGDRDVGSLRHYLRVAVPASLLLWSEWWVYEFMSLLAGLCGTAALASHTAVCQLMLIVFMCPVGLSFATSTLVGNVVGQGSALRARSVMNAACGFVFVLFLVVGAFTLLFRTFLAHIFSSDTEVVRTFELICLPLAPFMVLDAVQTVLEGALRGLGLQRQAARAKIIAMVLVRLLGAYVLAMPLKLGILGLWCGSLAGMVVTMVLYGQILRSADLEAICHEVRQQLCGAGAAARAGGDGLLSERAEDAVAAAPASDSRAVP